MGIVAGVSPPTLDPTTLVRYSKWEAMGDERPSVGLGGVSDLTFKNAAGGVGTAFTSTGTGTRNVSLIADETVAEIVGSGTGIVLFRATSWLWRLRARAGNGLGPSQLNPLYRYMFRVGKAAGVANADFFGVYFHPEAAAAPASPGTAGAGFGVCGNGAGGWQLIARKVAAGALTIQQALTWPVLDGQLAELEFRIHPATDTAEASLQVLLNGATQRLESWANGLLPYLSDVAGVSGFGYSIRHQNAAYPNMYLGRVLEVQQVVTP